MDNKKGNAYYLKKIISDLEFVIRHTKGITYDALLEDELLIDSIMFRLIQVSENSDKLTEAFKASFTSIPWRALKGMRNRIVHEYGNVDLEVVYNTVTKDIPDLLHTLSDAFGDQL